MTIRDASVPDQLGDEYGAAIGSVMDARKRYEAVCAAQGSDSWAAQQAHDYLLREMEHRNRMREKHDAAAGEGAER